jgi:hypothetical protein
MRAALLAPMLVAGCAGVRGNVPPVVDFGALVQPGQARRWEARTVRTYAVLTHIRPVMRSRDVRAGQWVEGVFYRVRMRGDPAVPVDCDPSKTSSSASVAVLLPAALARTWRGYARDTIFALNGTMRRRAFGVLDVSPAPAWLAVSSGIPMGHCPRIHPGVAP